MRRCERYYPATGVVEQIEPEQVGALLSQPEALLWIDLQHPGTDELAWVEQTFHFHPLAMEDVRNARQRPKLDRYTTYYFFVIRGIHYHPKSHRVDSQQLDLFVGTNYLVTIHRDEIPGLAQVRCLWEQSHLPQEAVPYLFYLVLDTVVDCYFPIVDSIGDTIDGIDAAVLDKPDQASIKTIFVLRRNLLSIRKILTPLRDALNGLIRAEEGERLFVVQDTRAYMNDVYDHVLRIIDFVDTYRDMLSGSLEAYQSSLSNRLNENMQRLTVAATVLATWSVITGFYGMNLRGMGIGAPTAYGGAIIVIVLVIITLIEIWLFRRKGWI